MMSRRGKSVGWLIGVGVLCALVGSLCGCARQGAPGIPAEAAALPSAAPVPVRITIAAAGDVLMHKNLVTSAYDARTDEYNFTPAFTPIAPFLRAANYALANFETRMAGAERGYSGYPRFNSPASLAPALKDAGFRLLATANNHCLDMGWPGIVATLDNIDAAGLPHVGTARTPEEAATPCIADIQGIRVAFLNYTFMTNGFVVPHGKEFAVNYLYPPRVNADAAAARRQGADLVIAMLHFGEEYQRRPNAYQRETAATLLAGGVDAIIAAHPHVVQPIEMVTVQRDGRPFTGVVAYSLGNFISSQRQRYCDGGMILYLTVEKDAQRGTAVVGVNYLPIWVQLGTRGGRRVSRVVPADPSLPFGSDIVPSAADQARRRQVWEDTNALVENQAAGILPYRR